MVEALDDGLVAVELDGTDDDWPPVIAPADAGVTAIGASVRVIRDSTGRVTHVAAPDSLPEDSTPLYVGSTGQFVKDISDAQVELDSAIAGATADAAAAQSAAQSAANDAAAAMVDAGEAITVASTKTSVKASNTSPDSPMTNDLWFPLDDAGNVIGMKQWSGSSWVDYRLMAGSIVVPGSVGNVLLENGAVSAEKIFANEALWAKIATFASVTTDMLLAGDATITGTLLADVIQLATRLVAGDASGDRTEMNSSGLHVFKGGKEKVRVSADTTSGLQVNDPTSNNLLDAASVMFGASVASRAAGASCTSPYNNGWGPTATYALTGTFTAPTTRAFIAYNTRMASSYGSATVRMWCGISDTAAGTGAGLGYFDLDASGIPFTFTNFHVYEDLVVGHQYTHSISLQVKPFVGTSTGWWKIDAVNLITIPC